MGAHHSLTFFSLSSHLGTSGSGTTVASGTWPEQSQFPDSSGMLFSYLQADGPSSLVAIPDCQMEVGPVEDLE